MLLMGNINWWMPSWMEQLIPHVSIEGAEFFLARDRFPVAEAAAAADASGPEP